MQTDSGTWGSDNTDVATVDQNGMVTGVAAGEATIFVDVNPRGELLIRVFPEFDGTWAGSDVGASCEDSGAFAGLCLGPDFPQVGEAFPHCSEFDQSEASVDAVIQGGGGLTATTTGSISTGGTLQLSTAPFLPADPLVNVELQNWQFRADMPTEMTGTYELFLTSPGLTGSVRLRIQLRDVVMTSAAPASLSRTGGSALDQARRGMTNHLRRLR